MLKVMLMLGVLSLFGAGLGAMWFAILKESPERREKILTRILEASDLQVDEQIREELRGRLSGRNLWGRWGAAVGAFLGLVIPILVLPGPLEDDGGVFSTLLAMVGLSFGNALSAQPAPFGISDPVRLASLQPHGFRDYLGARVVFGELFVAAAGCTAASWAAAEVLGGSHRRLVLAVIAVGATIGSVSVVVILLQRRLLTSARTAATVDQLVVDDIMLASGLRDLFAALAIVTLESGMLIAILVGADLWLVAAGAIPGLASLVVLFGPLWSPSRVFGRGSTPVAHELLAREVAI